MRRVPPGWMCAADTAYVADPFRAFLIARGTLPVIPNNPARKRHHPIDDRLYRKRNTIERTIGHLKEWRRIATRYDKLSHTFASAVALAILVRWWC